MVHVVVRHQLLPYFEGFEAMDMVWMDPFGPKKLFGAYLRNVISIVEAHFRLQTHLPLRHVPNYSPSYWADPSSGTEAALFSPLVQEKMYFQPPISVPEETWIFYDRIHVPDDYRSVLSEGCCLCEYCRGIHGMMDHSIRCWDYHFLFAHVVP
jgi:hypothetical protein